MTVEGLERGLDGDGGTVGVLNRAECEEDRITGSLRD